jgi:prepilin-type N-terminal cleavage/methylation domain-containing protein
MTAPKAFSLIELLTVMAIIGILSVAAIPAFNAIAAAQGVRQGAYDIAGLLELARSEAVARQTYVWVGFGTTNTSGRDELIAAAVYSRDGTGTNSVASNLASMVKILRVPNAGLVRWNDLKAATKGYFTNGTPSSLATNTTGIAFTFGQSQFQSKTLTFTPRGEVLLKGSVSPDDGFVPTVDISFRQIRGGVVQPDADDASILLDGATGMPKIVRIR